MEETETQRSEVSDWGPSGLCSGGPLAVLDLSEGMPNLSAPCPWLLVGILQISESDGASLDLWT